MKEPPDGAVTSLEKVDQLILEAKLNPVKVYVVTDHNFWVDDRLHMFGCVFGPNTKRHEFPSASLEPDELRVHGTQLGPVSCLCIWPADCRGELMRSKLDLEYLNFGFYLASRTRKKQGYMFTNYFLAYGYYLRRMDELK
jgi:hypothetical protein